MTVWQNGLLRAVGGDGMGARLVENELLFGAKNLKFAADTPSRKESHWQHLFSLL